MFSSFDRKAVSTVVNEHLGNGMKRFAKLTKNVSLSGPFLNLHVHKATCGPAKKGIFILELL